MRLGLTALPSVSTVGEQACTVSTAGEQRCRYNELRPGRGEIFSRAVTRIKLTMYIAMLWRIYEKATGL